VGCCEPEQRRACTQRSVRSGGLHLLLDVCLDVRLWEHMVEAEGRGSGGVWEEGWEGAEETA
jgi:hypothetical protein